MRAPISALALAAVACLALGSASADRPLAPSRPGSLAIGRNGVLYIADVARNQILSRLPDGRFAVVAGTGRRGFSGDNGRAVHAELSAPAGMAVGSDGTLYFADQGNNRVRAISPRGVIATVAGDGKFGWASSGTPALAAHLGSPAAVTIGPGGALYVAAAGADEILRLSAGKLTKVAGTRGRRAGIFGIGPATEASPDGPTGLAFDSARNLYVAGFDTKTLLMIDRGGKLRLPAGKDGFYPRGNGGLVTTPSGGVLAMNGQQLVRVGPGGLRPFVDFARRKLGGLRGFSPDGIAIASNGIVYADTWRGNGFASETALVAVDPSGRVRVLWKS